MQVAEPVRSRASSSACSGVERAEDGDEGAVHAAAAQPGDGGLEGGPAVGLDAGERVEQDALGQRDRRTARGRAPAWSSRCSANPARASAVPALATALTAHS